MVKDNKVLKRKEKENKPKSIIVGTGSPSRRVGFGPCPRTSRNPRMVNGIAGPGSMG